MYNNENSKRFLSAYNKIDKMLRAIYNYKPSMTFTDIVRRSGTVSALIRKYEDDLLDCGRLRNAIIHKSDGEIVIAEPHDTVVKQLEYIAKMLSTPPQAATVSHKASTMEYNAKLFDTIKLMASHNYSNIPVMKNGRIIGVVNNKLIVEAIAKHAETDINEYLKNANLEDVLSDYNLHYIILKNDITIDTALQCFFDNRKLQIILLTDNGMDTGRLVGVVTTGNILDINKIMDNY